MKRLWLFLLLAVAASAQVQVTITGTVQDSTGKLATSGYVEFDILPQNSGLLYTISGTTTVAPQSGKCGINSSGQIVAISLSGPCKVWGNDLILPANTLYKVVIAPNGTVRNTINNGSITGSALALNDMPILSPKQVVGPVINVNPLNTMSIVPVTDNVYTVGSPNKRYVAGYFTNLTVSGTCNGCGGGGGGGTGAGVTSLNTLTGDLNIKAGAGITVTAGTTDITVAATGLGAGTVTSVSSGSLAPLFSVAVNTPTTTPVIVYTATNLSPNTVIGNCTGSSAPFQDCGITYSMIPVFPNNSALRSNDVGAVARDLIKMDASNNNVITGQPTQLTVKIQPLPGTDQLTITPSGVVLNAGTWTIPGPDVRTGSCATPMTPAPNGLARIGCSTDGEYYTSNNLDSLGGPIAALLNERRLNKVAPKTFATLGTPVDGTFTYCSDCVINTTCAGSGTGAWAVRTAGAWNCGAGAAGSAVALSPGGSQNVVQGAATNLGVNRFEGWKFCDQFGSLQACHDDLPANGGIMWLREGSIAVCGLNITKNNVHLMGTGIESTSLECATAATPVITVTATAGQVFIENLTVKHITNQPTCAGGSGTATCGEGIQVIEAASKDREVIRHVKSIFNYNGFALGPTTEGTITDVWAERNVNAGFKYNYSASKAVMQWQHEQAHAFTNGGNGFEAINATGSQITCPAWNDSSTFGNGGKGWYVNAASPSGIADCWLHGVLASTNNDVGFYFDTGAGGRNHQIMGWCESELSGRLNDGGGGGSGVVIGWNTTPVASNVGEGIFLGPNNDPTSGPKVSGCTLWENSYSGIIVSSPQATITDISTFGNGMAVSANSWQRAGISVRASGVSVIGGQHRNNGAATQLFGIEVSNAADIPSLSGFNCDASITTCLGNNVTPTNGYKNRIGQITIFSKPAAAPGTACQNGDEWHRTDAGSFTTFWVCKNSLYVAVN